MTKKDLLNRIKDDAQHSEDIEAAEKLLNAYTYERATKLSGDELDALWGDAVDLAAWFSPVGAGDIVILAARLWVAFEGREVPLHHAVSDNTQRTESKVVKNGRMLLDRGVML